MDGCRRNCMSPTWNCPFWPNKGPVKTPSFWQARYSSCFSLEIGTLKAPFLFHCLPLSSSETLKFWLPNHLSFALLCFNMSCLHIDFARFCLKGKWHHLQSRRLHCKALWWAHYRPQDGGPMRLPRKPTHPSCANFVAIIRGCNPLPIQCKMFQGRCRCRW